MTTIQPQFDPESSVSNEDNTEDFHGNKQQDEDQRNEKARVEEKRSSALVSSAVEG